jgi:hypothetical protein
MAKLKATPKSFAEAVAVLNGKQSMRLGNNTYLENRTTYISVRLHNTEIVIFWPSGSVQLYTGGYRTMTTKERINQFIKCHVYQKAGQWFVASRQVDGSFNWVAPREFCEGFFILYAFETRA